MPGGELRIGIGAEYDVTMLGAVAKVAEGLLSREMLDIRDSVFESQGFFMVFGPLAVEFST